jgi:enoyl-CoA hydratase
MILLGRPVEATEAREWGLVNRVVETGDALDAAVEMAETIAEFAQETVRTDRSAVSRARAPSDPSLRPGTVADSSVG